MGPDAFFGKPGLRNPPAAGMYSQTEPDGAREVQRRPRIAPHTEGAHHKGRFLGRAQHPGGGEGRQHNDGREISEMPQHVTAPYQQMPE